MEKDFHSLNKFCKKHNFKTNNFIDFLIIDKFITKIVEDDNEIFISHSKHIKIDKIILINVNFFYKYINKNDLFNQIVIIERYNLPIYKIPNFQDRKKKIIEISKLRLLFLDFEFVNNQYYEVGFEVFHLGKRINKGYFFEEEAYKLNYMSHKGAFSLLNKMKEKKVIISEKIEKNNTLILENKDDNKVTKATLVKRNKINLILEDLIDKTDFMVVHNCNSELNILKENGIEINKEFCVCTASLLKDIQEFYTKGGKLKAQPSLKDLADFLNIKVNTAKLHYAYYDVEITRKCFYALVEMFIKELE